jgi:uncharacterized protein YndB with AHSA1/START domain
MSERKSENQGNASDREIVISRVFDFPRELVWEAWCNPKHVVNWWGPKGFTTQIEKMEVKPGGVWKHTMIGPDGTKYPNKSIFKEVVKPERIVYSHAGGSENDKGASFVSTWTFAALPGGKTELTIRMVFETQEARDHVIKTYGAIEGGKQTMGRLADHLQDAEDFEEVFTLTRTFEASRDLLFRVWIDPEHLKHWMSPKGFSIRYVKADIRPGGIAHYCMSGSNGMQMWGKATYQEIVPPELLTYIQSFSDETGGMGRHPMSPTWPQQMLTRIRFFEEGRSTRITLKWIPLFATAEEMATFKQAMAGMSQGWGGTFEHLDQYLAEVRD